MFPNKVHFPLPAQVTLEATLINTSKHKFEKYTYGQILFYLVGNSPSHMNNTKQIFWKHMVQSASSPYLRHG